MNNMKFINKILVVILFALPVCLPFLANAQELLQDKIEIVRAKVTEVIDQEQKKIPGTDVLSTYQTIMVEILEGEQKGQIVKVENDFLVLDEGDKFFLYHEVDALHGGHTYSVRDVDRRYVIIIFVAIFIAFVLIFSGKQGLKSLLSLAGSFIVILYILIPGLLKGFPPVMTSVVIASIILFLAIYLTHGFNRQSTVAFSGTVIAVIITGILAYLSVSIAHLSGFSSDEAVYLNINTKGVLDFAGLLLGGIMIGVLGVLDDIAITQAAIVSEIYSSAPHLSKKEVYKKALRVGREHVGALVNTLAFAYTGASLPLLLLVAVSNTSFSSTINQEIFVTEIVRTIVGSIGLILTVPITTLIAVNYLKNINNKNTSHTH
jgi:uncharacterized membrane protein